MEHKLSKMSSRYVAAFSWHRHIRIFLDSVITETPLLHVCAGPVSKLGDIRVDRYVHPVPPGVIADWTALPFASDSFGAIFADPPWGMSYMEKCAEFCKEALRVAPIAYVMSPWLWVNRMARRSHIWVREFPGVNVPILIVRYERKNKDQLILALGEDDYNAEDDFAKSIDLAYEAIRARKAAGGKGWEPP